MQLTKLAAMAVLAMVFVAACGSTGTPTATPTATQAPGSQAAVPTATPVGGTTAPTGASVDVCGLLSTSDLKTATGKDYLAGTLDSVGQCNWNTDASGANSGDLIVAAVQAQSLDFIKSAFGTGGVDLTVSGHAAFWNPTQGLGSIWVDIGGGNLFVLSFPRSADLTASDQAIAQALAGIAVANI